MSSRARPWRSRGARLLGVEILKGNRPCLGLLLALSEAGAAPSGQVSMLVWQQAPGGLTFAQPAQAGFSKESAGLTTEAKPPQSRLKCIMAGVLFLFV